MKNTDTITIEQKKALFLHINERLYKQGVISKTLYEAAKVEIVQRKF